MGPTVASRPLHFRGGRTGPNRMGDPSAAAEECQVMGFPVTFDLLAAGPESTMKPRVCTVYRAAGGAAAGDGDGASSSDACAEVSEVALSEIDRHLLQNCLEHQSGSWESFANRFLGLVIHVVNHAALARSIRLSAEDREDLCAEVFLTILQDDFAVLRQFRGQSSLATYLTVIARRVVVRQLMKHRVAAPLSEVLPDPRRVDVEQRISDRDEVEKLLDGLDGREAEVVRMYHLEGRSYQEISCQVGLAENSIGPTLSRARERLRRADVEAR